MGYVPLLSSGQKVDSEGCGSLDRRRRRLAFDSRRQEALLKEREQRLLQELQREFEQKNAKAKAEAVLKAVEFDHAMIHDMDFMLRS